MLLGDLIELDETGAIKPGGLMNRTTISLEYLKDCLLYTSDAADERSSVDLGGRRIIKKKSYRERAVDRCRSKNTNKTKHT